MDKQQLLLQLKVMADDGRIKKGEVLPLFSSKIINGHVKQTRITEMLYYLGAVIVFLGIALVLAQEWTGLTPNVRIMSTMGSAVAAFAVGLIASLCANAKRLGNAFYLIAAFTMPVGAIVCCDVMQCNLASPDVNMCVAGLLFVFFVLCYIFLKNSIFALFSIVYGTWLYFSTIGQILLNSGLEDTGKAFLYMLLALGATYGVLGCAFKKTKLQHLSWVLYTAGSTIFLGSAFCLGGIKPSQDAVWELLFPILAFGTILLGAYYKERAFQIFGTLYLVSYIFKITVEYFSGQLGWALALVLAGLAMICSGYLSTWLKKKLQK